VIKGIPHELLDQSIAAGMTTGFGGDLLSMGALKIFSDGALGPRTAWMLEAYEGSDPLDSPTGIPTITEEELGETVARANAAGIACAVHAIGDAACRAALNAFQRAAARLAAPRGDSASPKPRNRIEHAQLLHAADLPRLAPLSVVASMQPIHAVSDMVIAERHWGARCAGAYAWKSLLASGAVLAFGSDCPVETPDPLAGIHAAVTRRRRDGSPGPEGWRPEQRLSVGQAVRAYTAGGAYACGREGDRGTVEAGKRADLTILDRDIFTIDPGEIPEARADAVVIDGRFPFRRF
jgi:hypothetical protein